VFDCKSYLGVINLEHEVFTVKRIRIKFSLDNTIILRGETERGLSAIELRSR